MAFGIMNNKLIVLLFCKFITYSLSFKLNMNSGKKNIKNDFNIINSKCLNDKRNLYVKALIYSRKSQRALQNISISNTATVLQAEIIDAARNTGSNTYNIVDSAHNISHATDTLLSTAGTITANTAATQAQADFEQISLSQYFDGSDLSGTEDSSGNYSSIYTENDLTFNTIWNTSWSYWSEGWAFSNLIDSTLNSSFTNDAIPSARDSCS